MQANDKVTTEQEVLAAYAEELQAQISSVQRPENTAEAPKAEKKAMDFLPANQSDLQKASYWKQFFEFERF